jgi:hypothetical protein
VKVKFNTRDPDILGSLPAMRRAARRAMRLAQETGTPFWVMRNGKLVNLNPSAKPAARRNGRGTRKAWIPLSGPGPLVNSLSGPGPFS